jgi:hypothetical protein
MDQQRPEVRPAKEPVIEMAVAAVREKQPRSDRNAHKLAKRMAAVVAARAAATTLQRDGSSHKSRNNLPNHRRDAARESAAGLASSRRLPPPVSASHECRRGGRARMTARPAAPAQRAPANPRTAYWNEPTASEETYLPNAAAPLSYQTTTKPTSHKGLVQKNAGRGSVWRLVWRGSDSFDQYTTSMRRGLGGFVGLGAS